MSILTYVFVLVFVMYKLLFFYGFFVMHIFVRMTFNILMGFRHVHVCTNDYPFPYDLVFVVHISVRMTIHFFWMGFRHAHFCTNDYHFLFNGLSSFTFLYEWLPFLFEWIFVMHISLRITTIYFWMECRHSHFCTNDYDFFLNGLSSFIFLYEWLPFLFECNVVIYISVWMTTISLWMDFRHAHFCTND